MFPESKNKMRILAETLDCDWKPSTSVNALKARAELNAEIREFFRQKGVVEVETPLLSAATVSDPYIQSIPATLSLSTDNQPRLCKYLQTSPEYAMKRLLAAGSGPIYQLCKAFRNEESGRFHNPEFTILEWYRPDFKLFDLMSEMDELLQKILDARPSLKISYQALFMDKLDLDPFSADESILQNKMKQNNIVLSDAILTSLNKDDYLDILLTHLIQPELGFEAPIMVYDYPPSQAALAKIRLGSVTVAERFEVYFQGIELANGYHELCDPKLQMARFVADNEKRKQLNLPISPIDQKLIAALQSGLPACSGVALGIDRVLMLKIGAKSLDEVIAFKIDRA